MIPEDAGEPAAAHADDDVDDDEVDVDDEALVDVEGWEPELADRLGSLDADALYEEASWYRPISTGDIFLDVVVPGTTAEEQASGMTMILAHPSAMRRGAELETRIRAGPIIRDERISRKKYMSAFADLFTLPRLAPAALSNGHTIDNDQWAASLAITGVVESASLDVTRRIACLSPPAVVLLIQKLVNADTRHAVRLDTVENAMLMKLEEIEQLQTWNEEIAEPSVSAGRDLEDALREAAASFEQTLVPLRPLLDDPVRRGEVWRDVAEERRRLRP